MFGERPGNRPGAVRRVGGTRRLGCGRMSPLHFESPPSETRVYSISGLRVLFARWGVRNFGRPVLELFDTCSCVLPAPLRKNLCPGGVGRASSRRRIASLTVDF